MGSSYKTVGNSRCVAGWHLRRNSRTQAVENTYTFRVNCVIDKVAAGIKDFVNTPRFGMW